jgi:hypothetical protein
MNKVTIGAAIVIAVVFVIFIPVLPTTTIAETVIPAYHISCTQSIRAITPSQLAELELRVPIVASVSYVATGWMGVAYVPAINLSGSLWIISFMPQTCG